MADDAAQHNGARPDAHRCPACGWAGGVSVEAIIPVNLRRDGCVDTEAPVNLIDMCGVILVAGGAWCCRRCGHWARRSDFEIDLALFEDADEAPPNVAALGVAADLADRGDPW